MPIEAKSAEKLVEFFGRHCCGLSSIFNEEGREKIPFEAVYPYVSAPKEQIFGAGEAKSAGILGASSEHF